jgi:hypothetical protein
MKTLLIIILFIGSLTFAQDYPPMTPEEFLSVSQIDSLLYIDVDSLHTSFIPDPVTEEELITALELADLYLNNEYVLDLGLTYFDEPTQLRLMADKIEKRINDLAYIEEIRLRLSIYGIKK